jgi:hypothetical protein
VADVFELIFRAKNLTSEVFSSVTKDVDRLTGSTRRANDGIKGSFRQVNDVLELVGINVRDQAEALDQLQAASGKTASQLGALATAGLTVGAAMGGWKIGRWIADLTGSDTIIGNLTAKLTGMGDVAAQEAAAKLDTLARASKHAGREITDLTEAIKINHEATKKVSDEVARANAFAAGARQVKSWRTELDTLRSSGVLDGLRQDLQAQNFSQKDLADRYKVSVDAIRLFNTELTKQKQAQEKARAENDAYAKSIQAITDRFSGAGAIKAANDMVVAIRGKVPVLQMAREAQDELNKTLNEAIEVYERQGKVAPEAMRLLYQESINLPPVIGGIRDLIRDLGTEVDLLIPKLPGLADWIPKAVSGLPGGVPGTKVDLSNFMPAAPTFWQHVFGSGKEFGQQMAATIMGAVQGGGNVLDAAGSMIGSKLGTKIGTQLGDFFGKQGAGMFSQALGGMFNAVLPGIGALLGPLLGEIGGKIAGMFDRNKGRDLVKEFADKMGGFDGPGGLHAKLLELGDEGERLWIRLTQGVGRNNPEQARAAIAAIEEAFAKARDTAKASGEAQATAVNQALETAKSAVKALDDQIASLQQSIANEAPEEVMGVVEAQARARIAALEKEREAAQRHVEEVQASLTQSMDRVAEAIDRIPRDIEIHVRTLLDGERPEVPQHAVGAYIREDHLAMVHAGEMVGDQRFFGAAIGRALAQHGGWSGPERVQVVLDSRVVGEVLLRKQKGILASYGVRG